MSQILCLKQFKHSILKTGDGLLKPECLLCLSQERYKFKAFDSDIYRNENQGVYFRKRMFSKREPLAHERSE